MTLAARKGCKLGAPMATASEEQGEGRGAGAEAEVAALRRRIEELTLRLDEAAREHAKLREWSDELYELFNNAPCGYHSLDRDGLYLFINDTELAWLGYTREEMVGKIRFTDLCTPRSIETFRERYALFRQEATRVNGVEFEMIRKDGSLMPVAVNSVAIRDQEGHFMRSLTVIVDVTERKRIDAALRRAAQQEELLRAQEQAISELSCPLLTVGEGVLVIPLVGAIDTRRALHVQGTLLAGIAERRTRVAILDITGVPRVDAYMAEALLQTARAVELLGAEVVLTGIRPEVAQAFVHLGANLEGVTTLGSLEQGIAHALRERARRRR